MFETYRQLGAGRESELLEAAERANRARCGRRVPARRRHGRHDLLQALWTVIRAALVVPVSRA
jgi:hypothetical protein